MLKRYTVHNVRILHILVGRMWKNGTLSSPVKEK